MELSSDLSASLVRKMMKECQISYRKTIEKIIHSEDININQFYILENLKEQSGRSTIEISNILQISQPAVTQSINKLVVLGYVTKEKHAKDKRKTICILTEAGQTKIKELEIKQLELFMGIMGEMDKGKNHMLIEGLNNFTKVCRDKEYL